MFGRFLIDFYIDFKTAQEGPKTAQDGDPSAKTAPKTAPRWFQEAPKVRIPFVFF